MLSRLTNILIPILLAALVFYKFGIVQSEHSHVKAFKFLENYSNSSVNLSEVEIKGLSFKFLFAPLVKSPFTFDVNLKKTLNAGEQSLWVYASQANNHGQISIQYDNKIIGVVDNHLTEKLSIPVQKLSYVGDVTIQGGKTLLKVTGFNSDYTSHYAELGLIVFAPKGMSGEQILNVLMKKDTGNLFDFGLILLLLAISYFILRYILDNLHTLKDNIIHAFGSTATLLICICTTLYIIFAAPAQSLLIQDQNIVQRGNYEQVIDSKFHNAISEIKALQYKISPARSSIDAVPERLQTSSGFLNSVIFRVDQKANNTSISKSILFGSISDIQAIHSGKFKNICACLLLLIIFAFLLVNATSVKFPIYISLALISCLSILLSLRLSQGWDEFFINLRHSYMLLNHGVYSINAHSMIEASVDFIPLIGTTALALTGLNLIDAFIVISLLGNLCVIIFSYLIVRKVTKSSVYGIIISLLIGIYPNVIWVGATGFSAVLFSGWILATIYYLFFTTQRLVGLILLSLLTLVRTEGVLFAGLLMLYMSFMELQWKSLNKNYLISFFRRLCIEISVVFAPFVISLIVRYFLFGNAIPTPISFKNTNFDASYFAAGLGRFDEMISTHDFHILILITMFFFLANCWIVRRRDGFELWATNIHKLMVLTAILFAFIVPYYIGGGDWFPPVWNRYGLPFSLILVITLCVLFYGAFLVNTKKLHGILAIGLFFSILLFGYQKSLSHRTDNYINVTLKNLDNPSSVRWGRVDSFASLGSFLNRTLPEDAVVSSPEEATIMYFSKREMVGLLGVSNPEMVKMPLQPKSPGDILHRKRAYVSIFKNRPDVIALFDPVTVGDYGDVAHLDEKINYSLQHNLFNSAEVDIAYYRVGSFKALELMGYHHVTISYSDRLFSLFINDRIYDKFKMNVLAIGFKEFGSASIPYTVSSDVSKVYVPAVDEIMKDL
ncbi:MAG: hypothetical protein V4732_08900 [Pseudomonadota bacterium]